MYIKAHKDKYGLNWLLKMCNVNKNAYYNFFKNKKEEANKKKDKLKEALVETYHKHNGIPGYRILTSYLMQQGYHISPLTTYKYMKELKIRSVVRRKKPKYVKGVAHKVFENKINRNFRS